MPSTESPQFLGWWGPPGYDATFGAWQRTLPNSSDGLTEFSGRFVFEQSAPGGGAYDGCYEAAKALLGFSQFTAAVGVTGGGWYVNGGGIWGSGKMADGSTDLGWSDDVGSRSDVVKWYQQNVGQCSVVLYQTMFIDSPVSSPLAYNAGGPNGSTNQLEIDVTNDPLPGTCSAVTPTGGNQAISCEYYPNF